ncbi:hypothetical protein N0V93_008846 [Gnomoniopsis smithogilvyi]|uniref:SIMPL domain-containing protein n=1 Tax=Gnomoniopsis smithogilvyi TaxID=1191159 RepID=A0A9W8YMF0_9PEZI|nr:hypothetical protein N0V93_008846 [Gnomoniopsis smithogilvyi]
MTPQLKIHVAGNASVSRKAERGVLHIRVWHTSPSQADVSSAVATKSDTLTTLFRQHALKTEDNHPHPNAPITTFTVSAPSTSSHLPMSPETGRVLPDAARLYTAETRAEVIFRDVALLAEVAVELSAMENVSIEQTEWRLTDATRDEITRQARINAVRNAVEKANDYAGVVGREVVAFRIDDGHINTSSTRAKQTARRAPHSYSFGAPMQAHALQTQAVQMAPSTAYEAQARPGTVAEGPSLEPATISVSASVGVDFISMDGQVMPDA